MNKVRVGIIGMGNIGQHHAGYLLAGKVSRCELAAVCSTSPDRLEKFKPLKIFGDGGELMRSGLVDAVIIATPHQHATLGIAALNHGLHVLVEKPIAAHKADAERLIAAHQENQKLVFACMFQLRVEPRYAKIRELIQNGELGELARVSWIITDWYRTEAYYSSAGWRATWKNDGGGVLLNQSLHNLDALSWLLGMPARVRGFCQLGRYHHIEVEDDVTAYLEYPNGARGVFITSTGEAPGTNRFEIVGPRGKLVLENDKLVFTRNAVDAIEFSRAATQGFVKPDTRVEEIPIENAPAPHAVLMQNFVDAILDDTPLIAPGGDGLRSVELANAMLYSSLLGQTVELPLDGAAYERKLQQLIAASSIEKKVVPVSNQDFASSFKR
jgi:predicted dehydrogenase